MNQLLAGYAAAYARIGLIPIPLRSNGKIPACSGWQRTAPAKPDEAWAAFAEHAGNIGATFPADLFALDLDRKDGKDGVGVIEAAAERFGGLPATLTQRTPRGGEHRIFRKPPGLILANTAGKLPGVDIRAKGAQIAVEPSVIDGRTYAWQDWEPGQPAEIADAPQWLLDLLTPARPPAAPDSAPSGNTHITDRQVVELCSALCYLDPDSYASWTDCGQALKCLGDTGRALWMEWSKRSSKFDVDDASRKWDELRGERTGYTAIFSKAQQAGWVNPLFNDATRQRGTLTTAPALPDFSPPSPDDLAGYQLSPHCLVRNLLFADVRCRYAQGGTGKTTLALYEAVHLALGRSLWGREATGQWNTLIVTREDSREQMLARLREIMTALLLSTEQVADVLQRVRVLDLTGRDFRLAAIVGDIVTPNLAAIELLAGDLEAANFIPDWLIFDPLISFSTGEQRVNDAMQGMIEAGRILRNRLGCCVEFIHHVGKLAATEKQVDQYAGRGGGALSDGARMVAVMIPLNAGEWRQATGRDLGSGASGVRMTFPKLSYAKPQPDVFIERSGWGFEMIEPVANSPEREREAVANQVWQFVHHEATQGRRYSGRDLAFVREQMGLSKHTIESALVALRAAGRIADDGRPGRKSYLVAVGPGEESGDDAGAENAEPLA